MSENVYLERYAFPESYFNYVEHADAQIVIVIPCFDEPDLLKTLDSLFLTEINEDLKVSVFVVINHSVKAALEVKERNQQTLEEASSWIKQNRREGLKFELHLIQLPEKHAGVGLARKVGMDDAVRVFDQSQRDGVILCLDADCVVEKNYLTEVYRAFDDTSTNGGSIHFEHELDADQKTKEGIILYEVYLRYYVNALRYAGYPMAVQTIGSSMAVKTSAYQKCGGMNRRKAGEDFYFIHKLLPLGGFKEITTTTVIPSSRVSDRVPFGTGAAIGKWIVDSSNLQYIYNPQIFKELRALLDYFKEAYNTSDKVWEHKSHELSEATGEFLEAENCLEEILKIKDRTSSTLAFEKQLWQYLDGLKVLKLVHFLSDNHLSKVPIRNGLDWLFKERLKVPRAGNVQEVLTQIREFDKSNTGQIGL